ncbi:hypothetical protein Q2T40_07435 [Winogradskyella maritima]|uniref:Carboxypeptidase-like protein n=1 Tax=Winogradskyella maritima TaxID=1517766 RepID=A0ABV8ANJ9_9FLAO|nr:hypothetical protein [Winogradskyella maritima]
MRYSLFFILLVLCGAFCNSQIKITDSTTKYPVSYATVSFGNGQGIFADDEGVFVFNKKLYPDVDSLFISALGYKNLNLSTENLKTELILKPQIDKLDEVVITTVITKDRKFKTEELKPYLDDDYYNCWLPTIESEIAVFFPNESDQTTRLEAIKFPIALESKDWNNRKKSNSDKKKFSTLFKVNIYANADGIPGDVLTYETLVFRSTETDGDYHELNVQDLDIIMPDNGMFVSLQVLGYTDKTGKLLPNKKYKEIKGREGTVKIPTNFRPLLPFTDEMDGHRTFVKRVFINGNAWLAFKPNNGFNSSLLKKELFNYGIGLTLNRFKDE